MNILSKLLHGPSPFGQLQEHLNKVMECVELVKPMIEAALAGEEDRLNELSHDIFRLEHEADLVKNRIRDAMPRELMMPVSRSDYLAFLHRQDSLADMVEDLAMVLSLRPLKLPEDCEKGACAEQLRHLADHAVDAARGIAEMTRKMDQLKQRGWKEHDLIEEIRRESDAIGQLEWKADKHQFRLVRRLLSPQEEEPPFIDKYVAMEVIRTLGKLADQAEGMGDHLRLMIAE